MISREILTSKRKYVKNPVNGTGEITLPHVFGSDDSFDPVIIWVRIFERQVNRAYMDSGSSCEVIYEHYFLKLKLSIRALRMDSKIPLIGFLGEHSWPFGEVPLEGIVGESPYTRTKTLNFIIVRLEEGEKKIKETVPEATKNILNCVGVEEKIIVNDKLPSDTNGQGGRRQNNLFTRKGVFCYRKMPFGLKKARATYQRLIDKTFDRLRSINMKLNPKKCSFGVEEGPLLGHLITKQGIKDNPSKVKAIIDLKPPRTLKEIQRLNGKLATLSRFLLKGANKSLPYNGQLIQMNPSKKLSS
ncbi:hypothetical protein Tco_0417716 [Tanacetum coccineum]